MMKKELKNLKTHLETLTAKTHKGYRTKVVRVLKSYGFTEFGSGAFSTAFKCEKLGVVAKVLDDEGTKFHGRYPEGYLKPLFMTSNRTVAVQPIAKTKRDLNEEIESSRREIAILEGYLAKLQRDLMDKRKNLTIAQYNAERVFPENVANHTRIGDLHDGNIGIHEGNVVMFDLNSQFKAPYLKRGEENSLLTLDP